MKNHYEGITPDQQWRNDMLNELRQINILLGQIAETNGKVGQANVVNNQMVQGAEHDGRPVRRGKRGQSATG